MTVGWRPRGWRAMRPWLGLIAGLAAYAALRAVLVHAIGSQGLVTPSGAPGKAVAALALALLVMRVTVLVAVPLIATYRVVRWLLARASGPRDGASSGASAGGTVRPRSRSGR